MDTYEAAKCQLPLAEWSIYTSRVEGESNDLAGETASSPSADSRVSAYPWCSPITGTGQYTIRSSLDEWHLETAVIVLHTR